MNRSQPNGQTALTNQSIAGTKVGLTHSGSNTGSNPITGINKHKKILPTFNGDTTNVAFYNSFKIKFKQYLEYYKVPTELVHSVLSDALTADASFWFIGYTEEVPQVVGMNYEDLMIILDEEFLNPLAQSKYQYDYEQLKPDYNEGIEELSKRIQKAAIKAGLKNRSNQAKKHKLFSLLPNWLQSSQVNTLNNDNCSFEEFKTNLIHFREINHYKNNNTRKTWPSNNINRSEHDNRPNRNNGNNDNHHNNNNNHRQQSTANLRWQNDKPTCEYCKKTNHSTNQCSNLMKNYINKDPEALKF